MTASELFERKKFARRRACWDDVFYSECLFILRCYFNELDAKSPYRHGIICSEKTHIYFKGKGGGSSRILSTFLKMSFFALLTVTLSLRLTRYMHFFKAKTHECFCRPTIFLAIFKKSEWNLLLIIFENVHRDVFLLPSLKCCPIFVVFFTEKWLTNRMCQHQRTKSGTMRMKKWENRESAKTKRMSRWNAH